MPVGAAFHVADFVFKRPDLEGVLDRHLQPLGPDRLDDKIGGPGAHGGNNGINRAIGRLDDDRNRQITFTQRCQHAHAVKFGHHQIKNHHVDGIAIWPAQQPQGRITGFGCQGLIAKAAQHRFQQTALYGIVINNQDGGRHRPCKG